MPSGTTLLVSEVRSQSQLAVLRGSASFCFCVVMLATACCIKTTFAATELLLELALERELEEELEDALERLELDELALLLDELLRDELEED